MTALAPAITARRPAGRTMTDVALVVLGSLVIAGLAQISFGEVVPFSGQTLGVMLVAGSLGAVRGGSATLLYLVEGAMGLPFFAQGKSGLAYVTSMDPLHTTGGYLWGFVIAAVLIGYLCEQGWDRKVSSAIGAMFLGEIVIFAFGLWWLQQALDIPLKTTLEFGLYPFVIGDVAKVLIAAGALPTAWKLLGKGADSPGGAKPGI